MYENASELELVVMVKLDVDVLVTVSALLAAVVMSVTLQE